METFTLFPLLPTELRLKIWKYVAHQPRDVELSCTPMASHIPRGQWFSHTPPPSILHTCSESRFIALSSYSTLQFSSKHWGTPSSKPIWFNFESETLWLAGDLYVKWAQNLLEENEQLKERLRWLAVKESVWEEIKEGDREVPSWSYEDLYSLRPPVAPLRKGLRALEEVRFHS